MWGLAQRPHQRQPVSERRHVLQAYYGTFAKERARFGGEELQNCGAASGVNHIREEVPPQAWSSSNETRNLLGEHAPPFDADHQRSSAEKLPIRTLDDDETHIVMLTKYPVPWQQPCLPKQEDMRPQPISPYAASKLANEAYAAAFCEVYGLETVCLRYFNVFGPRQDPTSQYAAVIPLFIKAMLRGERPTIYGDGEQSRDFTFVANVVDANLLAAQAPAAPGRVLNIACGSRTTVNDLVRTLNLILRTQIEPIYADPRPGDVKHSLADISAAREVLGYEPKTDFETGLAQTVEWYRREA